MDLPAVALKADTQRKGSDSFILPEAGQQLRDAELPQTAGKGSSDKMHV